MIVVGRRVATFACAKKLHFGSSFVLLLLLLLFFGSIFCSAKRRNKQRNCGFFCGCSFVELFPRATLPLQAPPLNEFDGSSSSRLASW